MAGPQILQHFQGRINYLEMLRNLNTTAEEWFRIELLWVLNEMPSITITSTNQQTQNAADRPDITLRFRNDNLQIELKVLPKDRNYSYGWQRFLASANNRRDFENVRDQVRHGIIYIYWPELDDWQNCRTKLEEAYLVACVRQDALVCNDGVVIISYWARTDADQSSAQGTGPQATRL